MKKIKSQFHPSDKRKFFLTALSLSIIVLFSFYPAAKNSFINWDDNAYVFENNQLNKPITDAVEYFFGAHYFIGNYIPVTMIVYTIEYHAAGLNPVFFHTVNILIHLLNVLLVFWFIYLLSDKKLMVAGIVSLFFGIHPMHVESVAWIAELKDLLYSFFFISGLIFYLKHYQSLMENHENSKPLNKFKTLYPVFIFFSLSVLSKPAAIIFPITLLLIDFYKGRKFEKQLWLEKLPFLLVSVTFGIIALYSQKSDRLLHDYYPSSQRIFFASHSLILYLLKFFIPIKLSIFYPYPVIINERLPYAYYLSFALVLGLLFAVYKSLKISRLIAFGFLFFAVNLILVLQIISFGEAIMADRYSYISYLGLFFVIAMWCDKLLNGNKQKRYKNSLVILIVACFIACSFQTRSRCEVWKDDETIASDLLKKFPDNGLALNNMGFIRFCQKRYSEAIELYARAIELKPDYVMAYINLADSYYNMNDIDKALQTINKAIENAKPDYNVLNQKGYLLMISKKYTEAILSLNESIRLKKDNVNPYSNLAQCYYELNDFSNSLKNLDVALSYQPDNYQFLNSKGYILMRIGKYHEAADYFKASLSRKPDYDVASANLMECNRKLNEINR